MHYEGEVVVPVEDTWMSENQCPRKATAGQSDVGSKNVDESLVDEDSSGRNAKDLWLPMIVKRSLSVHAKRPDEVMF